MMEIEPLPCLTVQHPSSSLGETPQLPQFNFPDDMEYLSDVELPFAHPSSEDSTEDEMDWVLDDAPQDYIFAVDPITGAYRSGLLEEDEMKWSYPLRRGGHRARAGRIRPADQPHIRKLLPDDELGSTFAKLAPSSKGIKQHGQPASVAGGNGARGGTARGGQGSTRGGRGGTRPGPGNKGQETTKKGEDKDQDDEESESGGGEGKTIELWRPARDSKRLWYYEDTANRKRRFWSYVKALYPSPVPAERTFALLNYEQYKKWIEFAKAEHIEGGVDTVAPEYPAPFIKEIRDGDDVDRVLTELRTGEEEIQTIVVLWRWSAYHELAMRDIRDATKITEVPFPIPADGLVVNEAAINTPNPEESARGFHTLATRISNAIGALFGESQPFKFTVERYHGEWVEIDKNLLENNRYQFMRDFFWRIDHPIINVLPLEAQTQHRTYEDAVGPENPPDPPPQQPVDPVQAFSEVTDKPLAPELERNFTDDELDQELRRALAAMQRSDADIERQDDCLGAMEALTEVAKCKRCQEALVFATWEDIKSTLRTNIEDHHLVCSPENALEEQDPILSALEGWDRETLLTQYRKLNKENYEMKRKLKNNKGTRALPAVEALQDELRTSEEEKRKLEERIAKADEATGMLQRERDESKAQSDVLEQEKTEWQQVKLSLEQAKKTAEESLNLTSSNLENSRGLARHLQERLDAAEGSVESLSLETNRGLARQLQESSSAGEGSAEHLKTIQNDIAKAGADRDRIQKERDDIVKQAEEYRKQAEKKKAESKKALELCQKDGGQVLKDLEDCLEHKKKAEEQREKDKKGIDELKRMLRKSEDEVLRWSSQLAKDNGVAYLRNQIEDLKVQLEKERRKLQDAEEKHFRAESDWTKTTVGKSHVDAQQHKDDIQSLEGELHKLRKENLRLRDRIRASVDASDKDGGLRKQLQNCRARGQALQIKITDLQTQLKDASQKSGRTDGDMSTEDEPGPDASDADLRRRLGDMTKQKDRFKKQRDDFLRQRDVLRRRLDECLKSKEAADKDKPSDGQGSIAPDLKAHSDQLMQMKIKADSDLEKWNQEKADLQKQLKDIQGNKAITDKSLQDCDTERVELRKQLKDLQDAAKKTAAPPENPPPPPPPSRRLVHNITATPQPPNLPDGIGVNDPRLHLDQPDKVWTPGELTFLRNQNLTHCNRCGEWCRSNAKMLQHGSDCPRNRSQGRNYVQNFLLKTQKDAMMLRARSDPPTAWWPDRYVIGASETTTTASPAPQGTGDDGGHTGGPTGNPTGGATGGGTGGGGESNDGSDDSQGRNGGTSEASRSTKRKSPPRRDGPRKRYALYSDDRIPPIPTVRVGCF